MACFLVPTAEAIVTTVAAKVLKNKEKEQETLALRTEDGLVAAQKVPFSRKLGWLNNLLWGGSALLCFEHVWHGEVVPYFPFLTAAANPADAAVMLEEMRSVGGSMALLITAVWGVMLAVSAHMEKTSLEAYPAKE